MMKMNEILKNFKLNNHILKNIEISKNEDEDYLNQNFVFLEDPPQYLMQFITMLPSIFKL